MASFEEVLRAIDKLQAENPAVFDEFCRAYPDWKGWKRAPYGKRREELEQFLVKNGVLLKGLIGGHGRDKRYEQVQFLIKIPSGAPMTLTRAEFLKAFGGLYYLFRRTGRSFGMVQPIFISRIEIKGDKPPNYIEIREGMDRTSSIRQHGTAYLTQGSLVLLAVDERGHPSLASFAHVNPKQIETHTPILDGHLLASTLDPPGNANFVVRAMLVRAVDDRDATTGVFAEVDLALAEFEKLRPPSWDRERWASAFAERFDASLPARWDGNYFEKFKTHQRFDG